MTDVSPPGDGSWASYASLRGSELLSRDPALIGFATRAERAAKQLAEVMIRAFKHPPKLPQLYTLYTHVRIACIYIYTLYTVYI
jgi:hypothetical protein